MKQSHFIIRVAHANLFVTHQANLQLTPQMPLGPSPRPGNPSPSPSPGPNTDLNMHEVRRKMVEINPADDGLGLMSPFLWPPPPRRQWEDTGSFLPSRPVTDANR